MGGFGEDVQIGGNGKEVKKQRFKMWLHLKMRGVRKQGSINSRDRLNGTSQLCLMSLVVHWIIHGASNSSSSSSRSMQNQMDGGRSTISLTKSSKA